MCLPWDQSHRTACCIFIANNLQQSCKPTYPPVSPPPPPPHCGELYTLVFRHIPSKRKSNLTERSEMRIQIMLLPAQSRFFRMLIPLSMFLLDSDKGKVKYSPLYGRGSKVTILVGRHFQSGMLPFERA